ncbi:hypothetical protein BH09GEM1_BH09GEM1_28340 [soil metagenome]
MAEAPLFSIGVTTFRRPALLRECVASLLAQTDGDLEVIIGNDWQDELVTAGMLGVSDPRVRIMNHATRLGEVGNFNALLAAASGHWFCWLADDDYFAPNYLASARAAFERNPAARIAFASFVEVDETSGLLYSSREPRLGGAPEEMSGEEFLRSYWRGETRTLPTAALYERQTLLGFGGASSFADWPIAVMTEDFLLFQAATLDRVIYLPETLVYFRLHDGSWSASNADVAAAEVGGIAFLDRAFDLLEHPAFRPHYRMHVESMMWYVMRRIVLPLKRLSDRFDYARQAAYVMRCLGRMLRRWPKHPLAITRVALALFARSAVAALRLKPAR